MKRLLLLVVVFTIGVNLNAQITLPKKDPTALVNDFVKPPAIGDIGKTTSGIMGLLGGLGLTDAQKPKLTDAISGFLGQKKGILDLAGKNQADYLKKFNPMQKGLFDKMKGIMGANMFSKFLGMKPTGKNIGTSLLSNLFF
jgi:hypothetical protein